jgi:predicted RNase H-like nuclease
MNNQDISDITVRVLLARIKELELEIVRQYRVVDSLRICEGQLVEKIWDLEKELKYQKLMTDSLKQTESEIIAKISDKRITMLEEAMDTKTRVYDRLLRDYMRLKNEIK